MMSVKRKNCETREISKERALPLIGLQHPLNSLREDRGTDFHFESFVLVEMAHPVDNIEFGRLEHISYLPEAGEVHEVRYIPGF